MQLWQSHTSGLPSLLFGFNPARNGPALYNGSFDKLVWSESGITVSGLPYRWFACRTTGTSCCTGRLTRRTSRTFERSGTPAQPECDPVAPWRMMPWSVLATQPSAR